MLRKRALSLLRLTAFGIALASGTPVTAQGLFALLSPRAGLPPPPVHFTHRLATTTKPEPERPPLQFDVRPQRRGGTRYGSNSEGNRKSKLARRAPPMDRMVNPLPLILTDDTLRSGDIVVFPDGPRVFTGLPGPRHSAVDFEKVRRGAVQLSRRTRDALAMIKAGVNHAWAEVRLGIDGKLKGDVPRNAYTEKLGSSDQVDGTPRAQALASPRSSP
jgi:hypothetical protein